MSTTQNTEDGNETDGGFEWGSLTKAQKTFLKQMNDVAKTNKELEEATGLSHYYVYQLLMDLLDKGLVDREKNGRTYQYWLNKDGLIEFSRRGLVEPTKNALEDDDVFEAYHVGLNSHEEYEGEMKLDIEEEETAANVSIERGLAAYRGLETGLDQTWQHFSERPVKDTGMTEEEEVEELEEELDDEIQTLIEEMEEAEAEASETDGESEPFLILELDEEEAFRIIAGEPLDKADRIALFDSLVSR